MECTITGVLNGHCANGKLSAREGFPIIKIEQAMDKNLEVLWHSFVPASNSFLSTSYLKSLEEVNGNELELRYVTFHQKNQLIGVAAFQITHFATSADAYSNPVMRFLHRTVQFVKLGHVHNILICGNAIATGEHGFVFDHRIEKAESVELLVNAMNMIAKEEKAKRKRICAMVVKDFYSSSEQLPKGFEKFGFKSFRVDHNMVMPLLPEWKTFDDYLNALVTKFRTKAKSALSKSSSLVVENMTAETIEQHLPVIKKLYENVHYKADFRLGKMNVDSLPLMLKQMPAKFFVKTYSLNGEVVGFMTAMNCGETLEAHIIGLNYDYNKEHAVYQRILYDYVALGIELGCHYIILGRTAEEIKSTIGAFPVELTCAMIHQRSISNALLKMLIRYVGPSHYEQRQPYKADVLNKINEKERYVMA